MNRIQTGPCGFTLKPGRAGSMRRPIFHGNFRLGGSLALHRLNLLNVLLALLCLALIVVYVWHVPSTRGQLKEASRALAALQLQNTALGQAHAKNALPDSQASQPKDIFSVLGDERQLNSYFGIIFDLVRTSGLQLVQVEYRARVKVANGVSRQDVSIGMQGSYAQVKAFLATSLPALPFLSLNSLEMRRDKVANPMLVARFEFSVYLADLATDDKGLAEAERKKPLAERQTGSLP